MFSKTVPFQCVKPTEEIYPTSLVRTVENLDNQLGIPYVDAFHCLK